MNIPKQSLLPEIVMIEGLISIAKQTASPELLKEVETRVHIALTPLQNEFAFADANPGDASDLTKVILAAELAKIISNLQ